MTTVEEDIKAWADKHLFDEQEEKKANPFFDYVTIPVKEYRELVAEKAKLEQQVLEYYKQAELYKDLVAEYKHEMCQLLGIKELKKVKEEQGIRLCNKQEKQED